MTESNFMTDPSNIPSMNRNNCRGGDSDNCMYYNSAGPGQSHYNYFAVQGEGDPSSKDYSCASKAFDYYNAQNYYGNDQTKNSISGYVEDYGEMNLAGPVSFKGCAFGDRNLCKGCDLPQRNEMKMRIMNKIKSFQISKKQLIVAVLSVVGFWAWKKKKINFKNRKVQTIIATAIAGVFLFF